MHRLARTTRTLRRTVPAGLAAGLVTVGLVGTGALTATTSAAAAVPTTPAATSVRAPSEVTTAALLTVEDVQAAGLKGDSATITSTGDATLNDGGHFDESCLPDKTIRAITGAKSYPARGTGKGYADGEWTSTQDKEVYVSESVAQGRTAKDTDRYVALLTGQITHVQDCQQDPAQGIRHAPVRHVKAGGGATADYYATVYPDGSRDGGGVAVVRDGTRFGIVSVGSGHDRIASTLKTLATTAARRLR
ncbi:MAG TPA: hypothetical protein VGC37_11500 [Friedmanniella sp.]